MLDREGYRPNVGIILANPLKQVYWGKRPRQHSWQFPQGGIDRGETPEQGIYRGQKQIWFLLELTGKNIDIDINATNHPEFEAWRWNNYWVPLRDVIEFKRDVYKKVLLEFAPSLFTSHRDLTPPENWGKVESTSRFRR